MIAAVVVTCNLTTVFDRFARWHLVRTTIDIATASAAIWALVVALD